MGLIETENCTILDQWLTKAATLDTNERQEISQLQELLKANVLHWNEQELSLHFIGPVFSKVHYYSSSRRYNLFANRYIESQVESVDKQDYLLFGKPDEMIASGFREPQLPYFCFQEYKRERDPSGDPIGQVLAAMLVGQVINQNTHPIYGCYVLGRDWYFLTLVNKHYCISRGYDATTESIMEIFKILKTLKETVNRLTE